MGATRTAGGAALVVAGLVLVGLGARPGDAHLDAATPSLVNADRPSLNAHNSPAVAADPRRPSVVALADRIDTPRFSCTVSMSTSGGATWKLLAVPLPPEAPNCFWPDVGFDTDGHLLVLYTATGGRFNQPLGVWLQRFDGEQPSGPAVRVAGSEAFHARVAVDARRVLVAWVQTPPANADRPLGFEPGPNPLLLARSDDGGATFGAPVLVSDPRLRVAHPSVLVGAGGEVVVGALDYGDDVDNYEARHEGRAGPPPDAHWRVVVWRSTDGGATFGPTVVVADRLVVPQRVVIDLAPGPSFAADPTHNRLYVAWDAGTGDGRDVFLTRSDDGGITWLAPTRLDPRPGSQSLPAVGVAVAPSGRVDMVFYDRSRDPDDVLAQVVVASSWDGGSTFTTTVASDASFDTRIGLGSPRGIPQLGNRLTVLSRPDGFLAFWADTSQGSVATNLQDLAVASVRAHQGGERNWVLVGLGVALTAGGVALLVVSRRRSTPPSPAPPR